MYSSYNHSRACYWLLAMKDMCKDSLDCGFIVITYKDLNLQEKKKESIVNFGFKYSQDLSQLRLFIPEVICHIGPGEF